jgi:hypothetical protein
VERHGPGSWVSVDLRQGAAGFEPNVSCQGRKMAWEAVAHRAEDIEATITVPLGGKPS